MRSLQFLSKPSRRLFWQVAVALPLLTGCSSGGEGTDAVEAANAQNQSKISDEDVTAKQEADAKFLVKVTGNALLEVELGKLMLARASSPIVRSYGTRVVQERLELLAALRTLAGAKKLAIPPALGEDEQAAYHEVNTRSGTQLDKQAVALIVRTQKQDEEAFDKMKDDAYDGDIRGFAAKHLPAVEEQLAAADEVADDIEDMP
ncbi:DUF4142 domain-containing protein [Hymenobacter sp.]|uniref:DUF4142 domain-containing protein n=1 Tax=Hymenobacter sp. TaxID=1898978 RepID=UPI00286A1B94|nr:DUF4142 domain-containing protein [Hymenobacter sp.]